MLLCAVQGSFMRMAQRPFRTTLKNNPSDFFTLLSNPSSEDLLIMQCKKVAGVILQGSDDPCKNGGSYLMGFFMGSPHVP